MRRAFTALTCPIGLTGPTCLSRLLLLAMAASLLAFSVLGAGAASAQVQPPPPGKQEPPAAPSKPSPVPTQVPFSLAGEWPGTMTLTDAVVTGDVQVPDPLGEKPPQTIKKEECEKQVEQSKGKPSDLTMEFKPDSPGSGTAVVNTGDNKWNLPYQFSGSQISMGVAGEGFALRFEGGLTEAGDRFSLGGSYRMTLGPVLTLNGVWTVSRERRENEASAFPKTPTPVPTATRAPSPTPQPSPTAPRPTARPTNVPATAAPTRAATAAPTAPPKPTGAATAPSKPTAGATTTTTATRTPTPTTKGKDPLGPTPPGMGGVGKVPGPDGLTQAAGAVIPGIIGILGGLLGGLGGKAPTPPGPMPPGPPEGPGKTGEGPPKEPSTPGRDPEKEGRKAEIRRAGEKAQADAAKEGTGTMVVAGEAMEKAGEEIADLAEKAKNLAGWLWGKTKETAKGAYEGAKEVAANPQIITDTIKGTGSTIVDGLGKAAGAAANAAGSLWEKAKAAWKDPMAAAEAMKTALKDGLSSALNTADKALTSLKDFLSDPKKMWETVKEATGLSNFSNSLDPNRSLADRLAQVGIGVGKLYITIQTAGMAANAMKKGATVVAETVGGRMAGKTAGTTLTGAAEATAGRAATRGVVGVGSEGLTTKGAKGLVDAGKGVVPDLRGIPKKQLEALEEVARKRGVEIAVRPPSPEAAKWLETGKALPKPPTIHNKSISMVDEMIGAPTGRRGLVGHFEPKLPPMPQDPKLRAEVLDRYVERMKEWRTYKDQVTHLQGQGKIKVIDGVIHDAASGKPLVSDIDLAGVFKNGKPVPEDLSRWIVSEARKKCPGITHPDINSWYPTGKEGQGIMDKVMGGHAAGGKPLVTVGPSGTGAGFFK